MSVRSSLPRALLVLLIAPAAAADWVEDSNAITRQVIEAQAKFVPEEAASLGIDEFDGQIFDLKPEAYERSLAESQRLLEMVRGHLSTAEHPKLIQDLEILNRSLEDEIHSERLNRKHMLPYYNVPQILFFSFRSLLDARNDPERYPAALERLSKYAGAREGYEPIVDLAKARTVERFDRPGLIGPFRGEVERDLNNAPRLIEGIRQLFAASGLKGWDSDFEKLEQQLTDYSEWVREEMLPRAREDHRLPEEIYADNLKNFGVRTQPGQLIRIAQFGFQEIRTQMKSIARQIARQRGWENGELMHVMEELKKDQIPPDAIIDVYRERLAVIEDIIREHEIVTLPERDANIRLATEAESASIPAPFMSPPQLIGNTGQYGEFVLVQKNLALEGAEAQMDDWNHHAATWPLTVHEARPGHEMQFSALVENETSLARAIYAFNSANVEGWGLYAEAIMLEHLPLEGQLFTLMARLQRAGRMFMDPMVNLGMMTREEVVSFIMNEIGLSAAMANSEADRYAFLAPGQATAYYYGYMHLQRLRTMAELRLGVDFNQRKFHDFILEQGLLPPDLLRQAVVDEFIGNR